MINIKPKDSILLTILFFDCLGLPLTLRELQRNLIGLKLSQKKIRDFISSRALKKLIYYNSGCYFLRGKTHLVRARVKRAKITYRQVMKRKKLLILLQAVPFIKSAFAGGSFAFDVAHPDSDIDLVIITSRNRLYISRFFVRILERLWSFWENKNQPIHSLVYLSSNNLLIKKPDLYTAYELLYARVILGKQIYRKLINKNIWIKNLIPNFDISKKSPSKIEAEKNKILISIKKLLEFFFKSRVGNKFENYFYLKSKQRLIKTIPQKKYIKSSSKNIFEIKKDYLSQRLEVKITEQFENRLSFFKLTKTYQKIAIMLEKS